MDGSKTISLKLKSGVYFNADSLNGHWSFSNKPVQITLSKSITELNQWDNKIKTLVINVTDKCNLNCVYCTRQFARNNGRNMGESIIYKVLLKASEYAKNNCIKLTVQFHGGEPLIEFNQIISAIDKIEKKKLSYLNLRIQSNGTLLTEKILEECKKRKIDIGISLDGRQIENDLTRKDVSGLGTFDRIKNSLELIKKYQREVHCLTVITNINVKNLDKILNYFNQLGINEIGFLPLYEEPKTRTIKREMVPNMKKLAKYQKVLFNNWIELLKEKKYKDLNISTFQILIWNILASNSDTSKFRTNCGVGLNSLFVESDGSVWGCGAFSYADSLKLGDLTQDSLEDIQKKQAYIKFSERITSNIDKCNNCSLQYICRGGCIANGFRDKKDIGGVDIWCEYWEEIIKHILLKIYENPEIIKLIPEYNIIKIK